MVRRNHRFLLRSLYVFLVASCSLRLLAQTPVTGEAHAMAHLITVSYGTIRLVMAAECMPVKVPRA